MYSQTFYQNDEIWWSGGDYKIPYTLIRYRFIPHSSQVSEKLFDMWFLGFVMCLQKQQLMVVNKGLIMKSFLIEQQHLYSILRLN